MQKVHQQQGFTLIELIIVIVILGILAVTAAPRFLDLSSDANASTLDGLAAAIEGGSQLVYARSAIDGEQSNASATDSTSQVTINGETVETDFGYPDAEEMDTTMLEAWLEIDTTNDWDFTLGSGSAATASPADGGFGIAPSGVTPDYSITATSGDSCHVLYVDAASANASPTVTVVSGGC